MKNSITQILCLFIFMLSVSFYGCSDDEYDEPVLDAAITSSLELEEYIVAAADLQKSMATLRSRMNRVDLSELKAAQNVEGKMIVPLPEMITVLKIDEKVKIFNQKKEAVQKAYPHLMDMPSKTRRSHVEQCITNSLNVNKGLFALGIKVRPLLKDGIYEDYGFDSGSMLAAINEWMSSPDYVEIFMIMTTSGWVTFLSDVATAYTSSIRLSWYTPFNGYFLVGYYNEYVIEIGHTHRYSSSPSEDDLAFRDSFPSLPLFIWYEGSKNSF